VNNEFIFCELGCNTSYFEKCPQVLLWKMNSFFVNLDETFPILRNVHLVLLWTLSSFFFSVNFSGGQSNNWWFNNQLSPSHSWLHAKQMTCNQLWPYSPSLTNLVSS
jgi:hypothetical protein